MKKYQWKIKNSKKKVKSSADLMRVLLKNRGLETISQQNKFFKPTHPTDIDLKSLGIKRQQITKAINRIKKAKKNKEKVVVYGDYDADGVCATAVVWEVLHDLGIDIMPYIPERFSEGYGLNPDSIKAIKKKYPKLKVIISVDNGIVAHDAVKQAALLGIDVIITDHHEKGERYPKALAVIHSTKAAGVGIAWIFAREIVKALKRSSGVLDELLDLTAIGTIADQVPLLNINRSFAKYGLVALQNTTRKGLVYLIRQAAIDFSKISTYHVGFQIAPRINAAGRLEHAIESLRLLCTKNSSRASDLAAKLGRINLTRQKVVDDVVKKASTKVSRKDLVIVLGEKSYHEGVIGLAASKLVEEFNRPAVVISIGEKVCKASARSIEGFNIIEAIRTEDKLVIGGGGHPMAAGFNIKKENIEKFKKRINKYAKKRITKKMLEKSLQIDSKLNLDLINSDLLSGLSQFSPFGIGNPNPVFCSDSVEVINTRLVGRDNSHLKLVLRKDKLVFPAIGFGLAEFYAKLGKGRKIDIAFRAESNTWNGQNEIQLVLKDIIC